LPEESKNIIREALFKAAIDLSVAELHIFTVRDIRVLADKIDEIFIRDGYNIYHMEDIKKQKLF
jgi:hypothetical protein